MGFAEGFQVGFNAARTARDRSVQELLSGVNQDYTPTQTQVASGEDALTGALQAKQIALSNATDDTQRAQIEQNYAPTMQALEADTSRPASVVHSMGVGGDFLQRAKPFSTDEVSGAKTIAKAGVYSDAGKEDDAQRVLLNEKARRELTDQTELRSVMAQPQDARLATVQGGVAEPVNADLNRQASSAYLTRKAPEIIDTYLKQGKLDEAKKYRDFVSSTAGQDYTEKWSQGVRKYAIGDHQGALQDWQNLYNTQLYNDGKTIKLTPTVDGKQVGVEWFGQDGKSLGTTTQPIDVFAKQAGLALAPEKLVELRAQQEYKRESEAATLDRQIQLETLKQEGQDVRDDRRDKRLAQRLKANGGLTLSQQRSNAEIDAARENLAGLSDEEIRNRTTTTMQNGRENKLFDPALARAAKLYSRRKIGDDEWFDSRAGRQPSAKNQTPLAAASAAMAADPAMKGYRLGNQTVKGFEVFDANGKHVGFFGKQK